MSGLRAEFDRRVARVPVLRWLLRRPAWVRRVVGDVWFLVPVILLIPVILLLKPFAFLFDAICKWGRDRLDACEGYRLLMRLEKFKGEG